MFYQVSVNAGSWVSLSSIGAGNLTRTLASCEPDAFEFDITGQTALTDNALFPYNADVSVRRQLTDDTGKPTDEYFFRGRVRSVPRHAAGSGERQHVRVEGPWSWFESTPFRQSWGERQGVVSKPSAILFLAPGGQARYTTGQQIGRICQAAIAAGAPFTVPAPVAGGIAPPFDEQTNITCAQAVARCLAYHPHAVVWFDYSTYVPALRFGQRTALTPKAVALGECEELDIRPRTDLQVPAVAIYYERTNTVDGQTFSQTVADVWPPAADPGAADTLCAVYDLRGDTVLTVSQRITAEAFPSPLGNAAWWKAKVPQLNDYASVAITDAQRTGSGLWNILTRGQKQDWMALGVEPCELTCTATCTAKDGAGNTVSITAKKITLSVLATNASVGTQTVRNITGFQPGEAVPTGVAQAMHSEWSQLHFEGSFATVRDECPGDILPGNAVNITGGRPEWAAMGAMAVRVSEQIDAGRTTVEFGPVRGIDLDARVMFERAARSRNFAMSAQIISGEADDDGLGGSDMPVQIRDGDTDAMSYFETVRDLTDPGKGIFLDPSAIPDSGDADAKAVMPRQVYLPVISGGKVTGARAAVVMCGGLSGTEIEIEGGGAELGTDTPLPDAGPGSAGNAAAAAPSDHSHPLSAAYALAGHTHPGYATQQQITDIWGYLGSLDAVTYEEFLEEALLLNYKIEEIWTYLDSIDYARFADVSDLLDLMADVETLWDYLDALDSLALSDATPAVDAGSGSAGAAGSAARGDHQHPLNVLPSSSDLWPTRVTNAGHPGWSPYYARFDHMHEDRPAVSDQVIGLSANTLAPDATAWQAGQHINNNTPIQGTGIILSVQTRTLYDTSTSAPQLYGYYRDMRFDRYGKLYAVSAETRHVIATPKLGY